MIHHTFVATSVQQFVVQTPWNQSSDDYPHINTVLYRAMSDGKTSMAGHLIGAAASE